MADKISAKAVDMIIGFEVSSQAYYEKHYQRPEWPGGASGITIAIGYDLGYCDEKKIRSDWTNRIPGPMVDALVKFSGFKGDGAKERLDQAKPLISIPWQTAHNVFMQCDVPLFTSQVKKILPNTDLLSEDCLGALVSIAYNRGNSWNMTDDRHTEMHNIKQHMTDKEFNKIPHEIRAMKRIWPNINGLVSRREDEAKLFENGMK
jgi:GH24 family phage-related lysozyme (muramidase)